jgi:hypothetical protein
MTNTADTPRFTDTPFADVDDVLAAAGGTAAPAELAGEGAAIAMFRDQLPGHKPRRLLAGKAGLAALGAVGVLCLGGAAAAATGSLPDTAQDTAREALTKVGVEVPAGKATAPGQVKKATDSKAATGKGKAKQDATTATPTGSGPASSGKGATISSIARDPNLTGAEKGAAVSAAASDGKSHAGENTAGGPPSSVPAGPPASSPSDTAPGKTTASTAGPRGATAPGSSGSRP